MSVQDLDRLVGLSLGDGDDRLPPQDLHAEQSVLGGMLLSKDAIADCVEALRSKDFYRPAHEMVYEAILTLYGRGEPADAVTVADELTKRGEIGRVGGQAYLHQLISAVPTAANAAFYAQIVVERAILRRLVEAGTRIVQMGYGVGGGDVEDVINAAQSEVFGVAGARSGEDYHALGELLEAAADEIEHASGSSGQMVGVPTGFADLDELTNGLHAGQMVVIAARPAVGKSTLALDIARAAAIKHQLATVVFSLEMSRNEITLRLLSAEASIQLQHMRKGTMRDEDWQRLARTMGEVSDAPLYIDDSPNMSLMEIRAKCRRLKQRHNLKLVVIDYLQLMSSGKRVESRQQEVSEFSRALKLLAKELEVPVIAISQLNRGPEQRNDKKPLISDLRESGCLVADSRILRADTGAETTIGELALSGERDVPVWALDESLRYVRRELTHAFSTGFRPVFKLVLASGKTVRATANHRFLGYDGWTPLDRVCTGDRLAVPRHVPAPEAEEGWGAEEIETAARICAMDGSATVPDEVFHLPKREIAMFLRALFTAAGGVLVDDRGQGGEVCLFASHRRQLDRVSLLLLRFGIACVITRDGSEWALDVEDADSQRRFLQEIGIDGRAGDDAARLLDLVRAQTADRVPDSDQSWWAEVADAMTRSTERAEGALGTVATVLDAADVDIDAINDVAWDTVVAVVPDGEEEVFDATVLGVHNFVANGVTVHNSIEQDADMVMLLHRESLYEQDSPREGEADIIVAKHRNGPTKTITVAFQGHYSRFTNMASNF